MIKLSGPRSCRFPLNASRKQPGTRPALRALNSMVQPFTPRGPFLRYLHARIDFSVLPAGAELEECPEQAGDGAPAMTCKANYATNPRTFTISSSGRGESAPAEGSQDQPCLRCPVYCGLQRRREDRFHRPAFAATLPLAAEDGSGSNRSCSRMRSLKRHSSTSFASTTSMPTRLRCGRNETRSGLRGFPGEPIRRL